MKIYSSKLDNAIIWFNYFLTFLVHAELLDAYRICIRNYKNYGDDWAIFIPWHRKQFIHVKSKHMGRKWKMRKFHLIIHLWQFTASKESLIKSRDWKCDPIFHFFIISIFPMSDLGYMVMILTCATSYDEIKNIKCVYILLAHRHARTHLL